MKIAFGCDHAASDKKNDIITFIKQHGHDVIDCGTEGSESVDYPKFGYKVAVMVAKKEADLGVVVCGTGIGIGITANKVKNIRCVIGHEPEIVKYARKKYDANVLSIGIRVLTDEKIKSSIHTFLNTKFFQINSNKVRSINKIGKNNFDIKFE